MLNKLQIVRVDNLTTRKIDLQIGSNVIGRGVATGNLDNPIAEHAVTIDVEPTGEMTITPMLACYIKRVNSSHWQLLRVGSPVSIDIGDICSLLPDKSWFKLTADNSSTKMDEDSQKRKATVSQAEEPPDKKLKSDNGFETIYSQDRNVLDNWDTEGGSTGALEIVSQDSTSETPQKTPNSKENVSSILHGNSSTQNCSPETDISNDKKIPKKNLSMKDNSTNDGGATSKEIQSQNRDEAGKKIKWDCGRHFSDQTDHGSNETLREATGQGSNAEGKNAGTESIVPPEEPIREKCAYGHLCYRRNRSHKRKFSHPGDPDWDIPDTRPECPYGLRCYRKNPQHKKDFKHTKTRSSRAQTPIRGPASDVTSGTDASSAEESVDESDWEPSCTSDEYRSDLEGLSDFDGISENEDDK